MIVSATTTTNDQAMPAASERVSALANAWSGLGRGSVWHPPTCGCGAGAAMPVLSLSAAESDLVDFLRAAAKNEGDAAVAAALTDLDGGISFSDWLLKLPQANLPPASLERLVVRIENFIDSLQPAKSGGRFTCI